MSPQDDPQWRLDRCGSVGASEVPDIVRKIKSGAPSATRASLMARKVCERLTGVPVSTYKSPAMQDGLDREQAAREAYEFESGTTIELIGVVRHPTIIGAHASPDGLVGLDGLVQFKCPEHAAHLEMILGGQIAQDYVYQMQWEMCCTRRKWEDFASYHPDFPSAMRLIVKRVERDAEAMAVLAREVNKFIAELDEKLAALKFAYEPGALMEALKAS